MGDSDLLGRQFVILKGSAIPAGFSYIPKIMSFWAGREIPSVLGAVVGRVWRVDEPLLLLAFRLRFGQEGVYVE